MGCPKMSAIDEPDQTPRSPSSPKPSKLRRNRARAVKARLWSVTQMQAYSFPPSYECLGYPNSNTSSQIPLTTPPGFDSDRQTILEQRVDSQVKECCSRIAELEERMTKLDQKLVAAVQDSLAETVANSNTKLLARCNERFTAIEVDLRAMKKDAKSLAPHGSHEVKGQTAAIEADLVTATQRIEDLDKTCRERFSQLEVAFNNAKEIVTSAVEADLIRSTQRIEFLETYVSDTKSLRTNSDWQTGDRIYLQGMKCIEREDKCGVIFSASEPESGRIAVLLDDETAPIKVPQETVRLLPLTSFVHLIESKVEHLGNLIWEGSKSKSK